MTGNGFQIESGMTGNGFQIESGMTGTWIPDQVRYDGLRFDIQPYQVVIGNINQVVAGLV